MRIAAIVDALEQGAELDEAMDPDRLAKIQQVLKRTGATDTFIGTAKGKPCQFGGTEYEPDDEGMGKCKHCGMYPPGH